MADISKKANKNKQWYYAIFNNNNRNKKKNHHHHHKPLFYDGKKFHNVLQKIITINLQPTEENFPELPKVFIFLRLFIAILYGISLGIHNQCGSIMILNAINLITFLPYMYGRFYLNVNMDHYYTTTTTTKGNQSSLFMVGVFPAVSFTILIWIYFFTLHHEQEIQVLSKLLLDSTVNMNATTTTLLNNVPDTTNDNTMRLPNVEEVVSSLIEDSEF